MIEEYKGFKIFWGDSHTNIHGKDLFHPPLTRKRLKRIMKAAQEHLDFFPIAYYPFEWYSKNGLMIESCGHRDRFLEDWKLIQEAVAEANNPGKFVTFLGYEWHGDRRRYGDHNVYYFRDYEPLDRSESLPRLYENLKRTDAIAIPHHTGYQVGERGKNWDFFDEKISPFVEIYSSHGSSEGCDTPLQLDRNLDMGPRVSGGTVLDGLNRGYKFGIIASGDNHNDYPGVWGNGLMAVFARELTRESIWEAFQKRRIYGVTGDRIKLYFSINGHIMGEVFDSNDPAIINVEVIGSHAIDRIEIIRNGRVLHTYSHSEKWDIPKGNGITRIKLRIECGWGPATHFGFKKIKNKIWKGFLTITKGKIISVEPCFTYFGQQIKQVSERKCCFKFTTQPRMLHKSNFQGAIFEIEANLKDLITIDVNSVTISFTLEDALQNGRVIALTDEAKMIICRQFGLSLDDIENPDIYWHHAWKMKIHRATPFEGYYVKYKYIDENPKEGENYYYIRITQLNGQIAWSSPIWMRYNKNVANDKDRLRR